MTKLICVMAIVLAVGHPALAGLLASAQHEGHLPAPARPQPKVEPQSQPEKILGWEPVRCWRQTSAGAITIGETFTMVLTCAVYEGDNAQVVPDESRLGVASIQLAPFEILGGSHPPDVHRGTRRFFQYDYQLRVIGPDAIGHDVNIPPLTISYRIHSRVGAAATLEGRDLSYLMPMLPIRVLSLVPADASDIRDASEASLGAVESLRFRSSVFRVLTLTFGALAIATIVLALVPLARTRTAAGGAQRQRVPDRSVLGAAASSLSEARVNAGGGWHEESIAHVFAVVRVISALAIDQRLSEKPADIADGVNGRLRVNHGFLRRQSSGVSSSVTAAEVARARTAGGARFSTTRQHQLEGLESALATFTAALYTKEPSRDRAALDDAARHAETVAKDIAAERSWWKEQWARH